MATVSYVKEVYGLTDAEAPLVVATESFVLSLPAALKAMARTLFGSGTVSTNHVTRATQAEDLDYVRDWKDGTGTVPTDLEGVLPRHLFVDYVNGEVADTTKPGGVDSVTEALEKVQRHMEEAKKTASVWVWLGDPECDVRMSVPDMRVIVRIRYRVATLTPSAKYDEIPE